MKFFFKTAFFLIAAIIAVFCSSAAFAESGENPPPIQIGGYTRFTGENPPEEYSNYYIDDVVEINAGESVCFPKTSILTVRQGAQLQIYVGSTVEIHGALVIEKGARVVVSGEFKAFEGSKVECFGEFAATKKSTVLLAGKFINSESSIVVFSGKMNLYKSGDYNNCGTTSFAESANATVSGNYELSESGKLAVKGEVNTTLNSRISARGYIYLSGKLYNTGELIFSENAVNFFEDGEFVSSRSGRVIDKRAEADGKFNAENTKKSAKVLKGIDVSYWQGTIEWEKVKAAGIDFAFLRASVGDYYTDETFYYNITEAQRVGIKVGAYHFCRADSVESAKAEAKLFLDFIKPYKLDFPVVVDIEDSRHEKLSVEQLTEVTAVFCEEIKKAGYEPMIYASASWLNSKLDTKKLSEYEIWVAHWGTTKPAYRGDFGVWQYSCKGKVSGIKGSVDLNVAYKNYSK